MKRWIRILLLAAIGCLREKNDNGHRRVEACGSQPSTMEIGADPFCRFDGARRYVLSISSQHTNALNDANVILLEQDSQGAVTEQRITREGFSPRLQQWLSCEHALGRRPVVAVTFCAHEGQAAGFEVRVRFAGPGSMENQEMTLGTNTIPPRPDSIIRLELASVEGREYRDLTHDMYEYRDEECDCPTLRSVFHIEGTNKFCSFYQRRLQDGSCEGSWDSRPTPK